MSKASEKISENATKLLELSRKKFGKLNEAEEKLFRSFADGEIADYSAEKEEDNDPAKADKWGPDRVLTADRITWLCTDRGALELATHRGILVKGARIDGKLVLLFCKISFPLFFEKSAFMGAIDLRKAEVTALHLPGTHTGAINADGLNTDGDVFLENGFKAEGLVFLIGAKIGGNLQCANGQFINKGAAALNADRIRVEGSVLLGDGFKSEGEVRLVNATIGGVLACYRGLFINEGGKALNADSIKVGDNVLLRAGFKAHGNVSLIGARISGNLDCFDALFINKGGVALDADAVKVEGSIFLRDDFKAKGEVRLVGARIRGDLACDNGQFINKGKLALSASDLKTGGRVFLRGGFKSEGEVRLVGATIGGVLDCHKGRLINKGATALSANRANIDGSVYLNEGFRAEGEVNLVGASIRSSFDCSGGEFINKGGYALRVDSMKAHGNVSLRGRFKAEGVVDLIGATIDGYLIWIDIDSPEGVVLSLSSVTVGVLRDDKDSWPEKGKLFLHGLVYDKIADGAPRGAEDRIDWLCRQPDFRPQPYEQLADVLRKGGQGEDARKILIAKNKDKARLTKLTWSEWLWYRIFGPTIGYGYRPLRALWGVLFFIVLGWIFFGFGYWGGLITPESDSAYVKEDAGDEEDKGIDIPGDKRKLSDVYPRFNFLVYSVDTFVPLINLRQGKYWLPNANRGHEIPKIKGLHTGGLLRFYLWIHILMGWLLSTLCVGGLTRLMRT